MSHSYTFLCTHFVFSTKGRAPLLTPDMIPRLLDYAGGIFRASRSILLAANAVPDHVHLLADVHPSAAHADLMREVKSRTSSFVREAFPAMEWSGWQNGYGAFSVSRSGIEAVKVYIARQEDHHKRMSFQEEFIALLQRHGIEYDERYVWGD